MALHVPKTGLSQMMKDGAKVCRCEYFMLRSCGTAELSLTAAALLRAGGGRVPEHCRVPGDGAGDAHILRTQRWDWHWFARLLTTAAGLNKMILNHLDKLFITNDAATILHELEASFLSFNIHT